MPIPSSSSNSKVSSDSDCSSFCLENVKKLKEQNEQLVKDLRTAKNNAISYKAGLESVEARLLVYQKNEYIFGDKIILLKRDVLTRDNAIAEFKRRLEQVTKEKDEIKLTVEKLENSSKSLNKIIDCQIMEKYDYANKHVDKSSDVKACDAKPETVRRKSGKVPINTANQNLSKAAVSVNTARPINIAVSRPKVNGAKTMRNTFNKAHSSVKRPFNKLTAKKNSNYYHRVNTVKVTGVNSARLKQTVNTARPEAAVNAARPRVQVSDGFGPQKILIFLSSVQSNPQTDLKDQADNGCSRHMTENIGGKITGKDLKKIISAQLSHKEQITVSSIQLKKTYTHRKPKKVTKIPQFSEPTNLVAIEAVYEEMYDSVERAATTATSLDAEQDSSNINRTQFTAIPNDPFS
ncbi:hypothetical protein Tco_0708078 [Tanacetum coccineum]